MIFADICVCLDCVNNFKSFLTLKMETTWEKMTPENVKKEMEKNPEMWSLMQYLIWHNRDIPQDEIEYKTWPASKPDSEKTNIVCKLTDFYLKWFTKTGKVRWETEHRLIELFNQFSQESNSSFSWPTILEKWKIPEGWCFFKMDDAKKWGKQELKFSKMTPEEILKLYNEYRETFDEFEKYSKGKISTETSPTLQKIYSLSNKYRDSILFHLVWSPLLKLAVAKKYKSKINGRISSGQGNVRSCGVDTNREKINRTLDRLLSKVKSFDFEYNFWRFWERHVFSDWTNHEFVDFDNVSYQIEWTELVGAMWSNLLMTAWDYKSYEDWKINYDEWYKRLLERYEDKNLIKLLLFIKLVWTVFEDYGNLVYKREVWGKNKWQEKNNNFEKIKKWVQYNYKALQELMEEKD